MSDPVVLNEILNPGTFDPETGEFCFHPGDVCFDDPSTVDTTLCLIFSAADDCGAVTIDSVCLQITANRPPVVNGPADTAVSLCNPDTVCLNPFEIFDPNAEKDTLSIEVSGPEHRFDTATGTICFLATAGAYDFVVTATDRCGEMATDTVHVTVSGNTPPVVTVPDDFATKACVGGSVCFPVTVVDPDAGDSVTVTVVSGPGSYNASTGDVCFSPDASGTVTVVVSATDLCGASDQDTIAVTVTLNRPPFWTQVPAIDSSVCVAPETFCFELVAADPDGDAVKYHKVSGPGTLDSVNGMLCFAPDDTTRLYTFVVEASDDCGASTLDTATVMLHVNRAPVMEQPRDSLISQCVPTEVCFPPFVATDPDGDGVVFELVDGAGAISGNQLCFTPDTLGSGVYCFTVRAVDPCGRADTVVFCAQATINRPPVIKLPGDFTEALCATGTVCFNDILVSDPDGQPVTVTKVSGPGTYNPTTGEVCFDPGPTGGVFTFILKAVDPCGTEGRDTIKVTVDVNDKPTLSIPGTAATCADSTLCFEVRGSDPDAGDVLTIVQMSGPGTLTPSPLNGTSPLVGTWCWNPTGVGEYEAVFRITDQCGAVTYDTTLILVQPYCDTLCFASDIQVICPDSANPNHWMYQGRSYQFSVTTILGRPVAAFDFLIGFDASALTISGVTKGADVSSWEYVTYRVLDPATSCTGPCPSGLVRILGIADLNNGKPFTDSAQVLPSGVPHEFARIQFQVSNDRTLAGQFIPVRFWWNDCGDNTFSSPDGVLYMSNTVDPDTCVADGAKTPIEACATFSDGGGCIPRPSDIDDLGDMNLNGFPYEIGDAVLYTNYFIYGAAVLDPNPIYRESQIAASDVNGDGSPLTVADMVFLIRIIVGLEEPINSGGVPKLAVSGHGQVNWGVEAGDAAFALQATDAVGGLALAMDVSGAVEDVVLSDAAQARGMQIGWSQEGSTLRVLVYSSHAKTLPGDGSIVFTVKGAGDVRNVDGELAGEYGNVMNLEVAAKAALPDRFALGQNYPNPFNPETEIHFTLGSDAVVRLTIYNLLGYPVSTVVDGESLRAGEYSYTWRAEDRYGQPLPSGVYMYRLEANDFTETKKMLLLR